MDAQIAIFANSLVCFVLVPQMIRLFRKKKARYLSVSTLLLMLPATTCWTIFAWLEHSQLVFAFSLMTALLNILTLTLYVSTTRHFRIL
jgi:uncharacterized protein with PQ loop repeat